MFGQNPASKNDAKTDFGLRCKRLETSFPGCEPAETLENVTENKKTGP